MTDSLRVITRSSMRSHAGLVLNLNGETDTVDRYDFPLPCMFPVFMLCTLYVYMFFIEDATGMYHHPYLTQSPDRGPPLEQIRCLALIIK